MKQISHRLIYKWPFQYYQLGDGETLEFNNFINLDFYPITDANFQTQIRTHSWTQWNRNLKMNTQYHEHMTLNERLKMSTKHEKHPKSKNLWVRTQTWCNISECVLLSIMVLLLDFCIAFKYWIKKN